MPELFTYETDEEWLALKDEDLSSTEIAAMYGLSPYCTPFELWTRKHEHFRLVLEENERMKWGKRLERVIAEGVAEDLGIKVRHIGGYMRHSTVAHFGSSFDFEIVSHERGPGLMEIKAVDKFIYMDEWTKDEAPAHIETQVQVQMEVADRDWCLIVALVGGNEIHVIYRERNRAMGAQICKDVEAFWAQTEAPDIDWVADCDFIISTLIGASAPDKILDLRGFDEDAEDFEHKELCDLGREHMDAHKAHKAGEDRKSAAKAKMLMNELGDFEKVKHDYFSISAKTDSKTGKRRFTLTAKKGK